MVSTHGLRGTEEGKELLGVATESTNPLCRAQLLHPRSFDCLDSSKCVEGNSQKSVCEILHSITLGNRHAGGQDVVGRENRPQSMGPWMSTQCAV